MFGKKFFCFSMLVCLKICTETESGDVIVARPDAVPQSVLKRFNSLREEGVPLKDALMLIRQSLVPSGYTPQPWRQNAPEGITDMLRSIISTFRFRQKIEVLKSEGTDFSKNLHVPEVDSITGDVFYHREDHNHILKRISFHTRDGGFAKIDVARFHEAMKCKDTDLDYHALIGTRKQNVADAENLLSHAVADFFLEKGYIQEEHYVRTIALWHEASDCRGMSQDERMSANNRMLKMILEEWIPWHGDSNDTDFSKLDINV